MRHAAGAPAPIALVASVLLASTVLAGAISAGAVPPAAAQTAKPAPAAPAPVGPDPSVTTATFGDWTARCDKGSGDKGGVDKVPRVCEAVQSVQPPNQQAVVAQIAIGRAGTTDPLKLVVALPVSVWFPSSVKILDNDKDTIGIDLAWRRCIAAGCVAENPAIDDALRRWRGQTGLGHILYKDSLNRDVVVPISFRGLAQALDALGKM